MMRGMRRCRDAGAMTREQRRIAEFIAPLRVEPGKRVKLSRDFDPAYDAGITKKDARPLLEQGVEMLADYQSRLAAQDTYGVLMALQAIDAGGKDSTIKHVMSGVNPQGVKVHSFKQPSAEELDHDYLWRYAQRLPARGEIGIFNRSHYEEVVVVRVHEQLLERQKLPKSARRNNIWARRYREINDWERYLTDNGFRIVKLFLNLSKEEQRKRFLRRIDVPRQELEVLARRRARARPLGQLPARVLGDALAHEHRVGPVVRHPGRPQVARAARRGGRARPHADGDRSALPGRRRGAAPGARGGPGAARGRGARGHERQRGDRPHERGAA